MGEPVGDCESNWVGAVVGFVVVTVGAAVVGLIEGERDGVVEGDTDGEPMQRYVYIVVRKRS